MSSSPEAAVLPYIDELGRKALHLLALVLPAGMYWLGPPTATYVVGTGALCAVAADVARSLLPEVNAVVRTVFGRLMRAEEVDVRHGITFNGATSVLVGAALLALLFPLSVAVPVLTMTILADAVAALVGRRWGRHEWGPGGDTVEGTVAFIGTGVGVMLLLDMAETGPALIAVLVAAGAEVLPLPVDDNIYVPLFGAAALVGAHFLLGSAAPTF